MQRKRNQIFIWWFRRPSSLFRQKVITMVQRSDFPINSKGASFDSPTTPGVPLWPGPGACVGITYNPILYVVISSNVPYENMSFIRFSVNLQLTNELNTKEYSIVFVWKDKKVCDKNRKPRRREEHWSRLICVFIGVYRLYRTVT